jgi:hypothetical protein
MPVSGAFLGTRADARALDVTVLTRELPEETVVAVPG